LKAKKDGLVLPKRVKISLENLDMANMGADMVLLGVVVVLACVIGIGIVVWKLKRSKKVTFGEFDRLIKVQNLKKLYGETVGVQDVSFEVEKGECFALLGVNGAGKTTCFKSLTGELKRTAGVI